jgi:hypothetical protein
MTKGLESPVSSGLRVVDDKISWTETANEIIVLNLETSKYLVVNSAGRALWHSLVLGTTHHDLVRELCETFGLLETDARSDVDLFLVDLQTYGLLDSGPLR